MDEQWTFSPETHVINKIAEPYFAGKDIFNAIKASEKSFSRELKFWEKGILSYGQKHNIWHKWEDWLNDLLDTFVDLGIEKTDILYSLLSEPVRNIADHGGDTGYIDMQYLVDAQKQQVHFHFSILDNGKGLPYDEDTIQKIFDGTYIRPTDYWWEQKWKENKWMWLAMIRDTIKNLNIDVRLHHHWKLFPINNLWLQPHLKANDKFGYEGYGIL